MTKNKPYLILPKPKLSTWYWFHPLFAVTVIPSLPYIFNFPPFYGIIPSSIYAYCNTSLLKSKTKPLLCVPSASNYCSISLLPFGAKLLKGLLYFLPALLQPTLSLSQSTLRRLLISTSPLKLLLLKTMTSTLPNPIINTVLNSLDLQHHFHSWSLHQAGVQRHGTICSL